jgi:hypothetical protein
MSKDELHRNAGCVFVACITAVWIYGLVLLVKVLSGH